MKIEVSEIQIVPVKPDNGKIAHASCVINNAFYLGSLAVYTKLNGGYRVVYPSKKVGDRSINIFHPISKPIAESLETEIIRKIEEVMNYENQRFSSR